MKITRWFLLVVAIGLGIQGDKFLQSVIAQPYGALGTVLAVIAAAVLEQFLETVLIAAPKRLRRLRRLVDRRSAFEGVWLIYIPGHVERPYAYAVIGYNEESDSYVYTGEAFGPDQQLEAHWQSSSVNIDVTRNQLQFFADGLLFKREPEALHTSGVISFLKDENQRFTRADGYFVDAGSDVLKRHFFMERLQDGRPRGSVPLLKTILKNAHDKFGSDGKPLQ